MSTTIRFETETCPRCGGCGEYSFNYMDGTRCYGCGGSGRRLSRRGRSAQNAMMKFIEDRYGKRASDVVPGDIIRYRDTTRTRRLRVKSVEADKLNPGHVIFRFENARFSYGMGENDGITVWPEGSDWAEVVKNMRRFKGVTLEDQ